ncbi:MAG: OmpA family protein [Flavobacteriales bacterium]|nr:OmpA family protein [Flavobacteriales bacterium]
MVGFSQQTTIVNHYQGDEDPGDGMRYVLKSTERHTVVINYYEPALEGDEARMQALISDAMDFYIDRSVIFDGQRISLKNKPEVMRRDLEDIVSDAVDHYHFRELSEFKGFSSEVLQGLKSLYGATVPSDWDPDLQGGPMTDKRFFFVESKVNELKSKLRSEVDLFADGNLLVQVESVEQQLAAEQDSLLQAVRGFKTNDPLAPMEIEFSSETLNLLASDDQFILPTFRDSEKEDPLSNDLADRILNMLEKNNEKIDALSSEVETLRADRERDRQEQQDAYNAQLQGQIDELRSLLTMLIEDRANPIDRDPNVSLPKPRSTASIPSSFKGFDIFFSTGGTRLDLNAQIQLSELLELMAYDQDLKIMVTGYSDKVGDRQQNLKLSQARAGAVRDHLLAAGIEEHRVLVNFFGEEKANGGAGDRRVEVRFL